MNSPEATITRDEPIRCGEAAGAFPDQGGMPVRTALLSPALRRRLREEADWALQALGAAGIAVFARPSGDRLEVLESRGIVHPGLASVLAQHDRSSPLERALDGNSSHATLADTLEGADTPAFAVLRRAGVRSLRAVPLRDDEDGAVIGALLVAWREPSPQVDHTVLSRVATHMALAIAHERQQARLEHERAFSDLMWQASDAIMDNLDRVHDQDAPEDIHLDVIIANAVALLEARAGAVALTRDDGAMVCYAAVDNLPAALVGTCGPATEGLVGRVLATGQPVLLDADHALVGPDMLRDACDMPTWMAVPITAQGQVQGVLSLAFDPPRRCAARDFAILLHFARFCGAGLRIMRLLERARQAAAIEQRQRLARDLHDSVMQTIFSLQLAAQAALATWEEQPAKAREALEMVLRLALGASAEMRTLVFELRENGLESEGLARALECYVEMIRQRSGLPVDVHVEWPHCLPAPYEEVLYRVAQEALTNVVKHARAAHARVALAAGTSRASLSVVDDGIGFAAAEPTFDTRGLVLMRERVNALGGTLLFGNRAEGGAYVTVELPVPSVPGETE